MMRQSKRDVVLRAVLRLLEDKMSFAPLGTRRFGVEMEHQMATREEVTGQVTFEDAPQHALDMVAGLAARCGDEATVSMIPVGGQQIPSHVVPPHKVVIGHDAGRAQGENAYPPVETLEQFRQFRDETTNYCQGVIESLGGVYSLGMGYHPTRRSTPSNWVPKARYSGLIRALGDGVLRSADTAGLQVTMDARSLGDFVQLSNMCNLAAPLVAAMTVNSSIFDGAAHRAMLGRRHFIWNELTPDDRVGPCYFDGFEKYVVDLVGRSVIVYSDSDGQTCVPDGVLPFWEWAYECAAGEDYAELQRRYCDHLASTWPSARPRPFYPTASVEARTPCTQPWGDEEAVIALYLGLAENSVDVEHFLLEAGTVAEWKVAHDVCAAHGLRAQTVLSGARGRSIVDLCHKLVDLAETGLKLRGQGEEQELDVLCTRLDSGITPADELITLFEQGGLEAVFEARRYR